MASSTDDFLLTGATFGVTEVGFLGTKFVWGEEGELELELEVDLFWGDEDNKLGLLEVELFWGDEDNNKEGSSTVLVVSDGIWTDWRCWRNVFFCAWDSEGRVGWKVFTLLLIAVPLEGFEFRVGECWVKVEYFGEFEVKVADLGKCVFELGISVEFVLLNVLKELDEGDLSKKESSDARSLWILSIERRLGRLGVSVEEPVE